MAIGEESRVGGAVVRAIGIGTNGEGRQVDRVLSYSFIQDSGRVYDYAAL